VEAVDELGEVRRVVQARDEAEAPKTRTLMLVELSGYPFLRMLGEDPALERIPFFTAHPAHVQRIVGRNLVDWLL
jgi:hypothetical protein